jgi:hypothetical protein
MKTKPAKLLMAMLLGMGSLAIVSTSALAEDSKDSKDSKDSNVTASTQRCATNVDTSCGVKVLLTTCSGSSASKDTKSDESDDSKHTSKDKDSKTGKNDRDYNDDMHRDHKDRSQGSNKEADGKISICHRMGGAEVSLTVANDGWLNGHSKHPLDTIGRCEDFHAAKDSDDSKEDKDKDHKISASDAGYAAGLTTTQIDCLSKLTGNGTSSISIQSPTRGGARTLH